MVARMRPWLEFTERLIERITARSPFAALVDARAAAGAVLALYIGMDLLLHLDGDSSRADRDVRRRRPPGGDPRATLRR